MNNPLEQNDSHLNGLFEMVFKSIFVNRIFFLIWFSILFLN